MTDWHQPKSWRPGDPQRLTGTILNYELRDELLYLYENLSGILPPVQAWIDIVTFDNSWVNYSSTYAPAGYYKDPWDVVHLRGMIKDGTVGAINGTAFTLPAGYRPEYDLKFAVSSDNAFGEVQVRPAGYVVMLTGSNVFFDLAPVSFRVI